MFDHHTPHRALAARALLMGACLAAAACTEVTLEESAPYDYVTKAIAIVNPDWGVIPLPNNFLNPVKQADVVHIPGVPPSTATPTTMAIPIVDATAAKKAQDLGYPVTEDVPLSKALLTGQNRLDGFIASFAPTVPFSRKLDMASVVPYDGTNAADANFWFVDITDPNAPAVLPPDTYLRIFNWEMSEAMPFKLSLRLPPAGSLQPPEDFAAGHTYMVVATGWSDKGIKALADKAGDPSVPFQTDSPFLLFSAPTLFPDVGTTYIGVDGGARSGVVTGIDAVRSLEGGRQLTDYALKVWEALPGVSGAWTRDYVVTAYSFTTATNPTPAFFDPIFAFLGMGAVKPQPADVVDGEGTLVTADAECDTTLDFEFDKEVDTATVNANTVKLYKVKAAGQYEPVELQAVTAQNKSGKATVKATPKAALTGTSLYVAAVTNGVKNLAGTRTAVDQTFFGVARSALKQVDTAGNVTFLDTPLVAKDATDKLAWQSPYLDSRLDTLILNGLCADGTCPDVTEEQLSAAGDTVVTILSYLEALRKIYKPHIDWMVLGNDGKPGKPGDAGVDNLVAEREDLVLVWTFTTGACAQ